MVLKKGLELLSEQDGRGTPVQRHSFYRIKLRMWLHRGEPVRWNDPWGRLDKGAHLEDDGTVLITDVRVDRVFLVAGVVLRNPGSERRRNAAVADRSAPRLWRGRCPGRHPPECRPHSGAFSDRRAGRKLSAIRECPEGTAGNGSNWRWSGPFPLSFTDEQRARRSLDGGAIRARIRPVCHV